MRTLLRALPLFALVLTLTAPTAFAQQIGPVEAPTRLLDEQRMTSAVEIAVLLTALSLLPAILITITSFTRIVIVLSFVRRALSTNDSNPPRAPGSAAFSQRQAAVRRCCDGGAYPERWDTSR